MIAPNWHPDERQLRQFAVACLPGFALVGYAAQRFTGSWGLASAIAACGLACAIVGALRPLRVWPVWVLLVTLTWPLGWLTSQVLLRLMFYGILTPLGLAFRLLGRDPLRLRRPETASYWQPRVQRTDPTTYYRQS